MTQPPSSQQTRAAYYGQAVAILAAIGMAIFGTGAMAATWPDPELELEASTKTLPLLCGLVGWGFAAVLLVIGLCVPVAPRRS